MQHFQMCLLNTRCTCPYDRRRLCSSSVFFYGVDRFRCRLSSLVALSYSYINDRGNEGGAFSFTLPVYGFVDDSYWFCPPGKHEVTAARTHLLRNTPLSPSDVC